MTAVITIRELSLDERIQLGAMFYNREDLQGSQHTKDATEHTYLVGELTRAGVPELTSQLSTAEADAVAAMQAKSTDVPTPDPHTHVILHHAPELSSQLVDELQAMFDLGELEKKESHSDRPLFHFDLMVPPHRGRQLQALQEQWNDNRVALKVQIGTDFFWMTPQATRTGVRNQSYVCFLIQNHPQDGHLPSSSEGLNWRMALQKAALTDSALAYVHFMFTYFQQPGPVQELHLPFMQDRQLYVTYDDQRWRVTGVSDQGTVFLSKNFNSSLIYDTSAHFSLTTMREWSDAP